MTTTLTAAKPTVSYHPIRGAIYGLFFGLGLALILMVFKVLALSVPLILVLGVVFMVLGGLWGRFAPPRRARDPASRLATGEAHYSSLGAEPLIALSPSTRLADAWCGGQDRYRPWG